MTEARVENIYEDRVRAREFLGQADRFLLDADCATLSVESRSVLLHNATVCACDALLQAGGLRVTPGDRSHVLRLETALEQIDSDTEDLFEDLDASRERRNEASYAAAVVSQASIADAREAVTDLLKRAHALLDD